MTIKAPGAFHCNNEHKVAYLAIRKCACTSIAVYIASHKAKKVLMPVWPPENAQVNFDLVTADEQSVDEYFTFTFVRNPYDRFLSFYQNWIVNPPHRQVLNHYKKFGLYENMPFEACVKAFAKIPDISLLEGHTTPQCIYIFRGKTPRVKFLGKLENISSEFEHVKAMCALDGKLANVNPSQSSVNPYTPELRTLIYSFYQMDFDLLAYDMQDASVDPEQSFLGLDCQFLRQQVKILRRPFLDEPIQAIKPNTTDTEAEIF